MSAMTPLSEIENLLRILIVEIRGLRADNRRATIPANDVTAAAELLSAIAQHRGCGWFKTEDLIGLAAVDTRLRSAIESLSQLDARHLGKTLQRLNGQEFHGLWLARGGNENGVALWSVQGSGGVTPLTPLKFLRGA